MITGTVRPDGSSSVTPEGVYDMAALAGTTEISPEMEEKLKALNISTHLSDATFKLEVYFAGGPRKNVDVTGILTAWTNGGFLNGGGDQIVYFCPKMHDIGSGNKRTCLTPIDVQFATSQHAVCPTCRGVSKPVDLVGQILAKVPMQRWATYITKFFHVLGCSADIRICVAKGESMRVAADAETERERGGERYNAVYAAREWITYPLSTIVKDTSTGSTLETRIKAFLEA